MRRRVIRLKDPVVSEEYLSSQKGRYFNEACCRRLIAGENVDVIRPDGEPLLMLRAGAIPAEVCELARPTLRKVGSKWSENRQLSSGLLGYYANDATRFADEQLTCRQTAFTAAHLDGWLSVQPFIGKANAVFANAYRKRWSVQRKLARKTSRDWVIGNTAFTTVTVNVWDDDHDARTPLHKDSGDLDEGFGVITVLSHGDYGGGHLVFPKWGIGVDLRTTDVLLCDVHEWHANTPIVRSPEWERIACIFYYRTAIQHCE